jgi:hypothetical protein
MNDLTVTISGISLLVSIASLSINFRKRSEEKVKLNTERNVGLIHVANILLKCDDLNYVNPTELNPSELQNDRNLMQEILNMLNANVNAINNIIQDMPFYTENLRQLISDIINHEITDLEYMNYKYSQLFIVLYYFATVLQNRNLNLIKQNKRQNNDYFALSMGLSMRSWQLNSSRFDQEMQEIKNELGAILKNNQPQQKLS